MIYLIAANYHEFTKLSVDHSMHSLVIFCLGLDIIITAVCSLRAQQQEHSLIVTVVVSLLLFPSLCPKYVANISSTPWHQCIHLLNQKSLNRLKLYKIQQKKTTNNQENRTNDSSFDGSAHCPQNRSERILLITFKGQYLLIWCATIDPQGKPVTYSHLRWTKVER